MFDFIKRFLKRKETRNKEINDLVDYLVKDLESTREDNLDVVIPTKYFIETDSILKSEYGLSLDYLRGNSEYCEVNVCDYVDTRHIGDE